MDRPRHIFKIGQQVYHHAGGLPGGQRTGPYTIIGIAWQSGGPVRYRITSSKHEQLAHASELTETQRYERIKSRGTRRLFSVQSADNRRKRGGAATLCIL